VAPWWSENGSSTYNDATQRLSRAFANWRKGKTRFPAFKSRGQSGSVRFTNTAVRLTDSHHVRVSRIGDLKTYESTRKLFRHLERGTGKILAATITERRGCWTISFTVEVQRVVPAPRAPERIIGVDVGLSTLYTGAAPDGKHVLDVANPRHLVREEARPRPAHRRTAPGSPKGCRAVQEVEAGQRPGPEGPRGRCQRPQEPAARDHDISGEGL
jgi:putative transposase